MKPLLLLALLCVPACAADVSDDAAACPPITTPDHPDLVCVAGRWHLYCGRGVVDCADPREPVCVTTATPPYCDALGE